MGRAVWVGLLLFGGAMFAGTLSLALMQYYHVYELGLLFPAVGVMAMFVGDDMLLKMEQSLGFDEGGAGASLMRSFFSACVVFAAATIGLSMMYFLANALCDLAWELKIPRRVDLGWAPDFLRDAIEPNRIK